MRLEALTRHAVIPRTREALRYVVVPAPVVSPESFLSANPDDAGAKTFWDARHHAIGERWAFAGVGVAARIEVNGPSRFEDVRAKLDGITFEAVPASTPKAPGPRWFGGFAFSESRRTEVNDPSPWSTFHDATFVLPRLMYAVARDEAYVLAVLGPRESARDAIESARELARSLRPHRLGSPLTGSRIVNESGRDRWNELVARALTRIHDGDAEKLVLARRLELHLGADLTLPDILAALSTREPTSIRFALSTRDGSNFFGATPELLVRRQGSAVESEALAGSMPRRGDDPGERESLLRSEKDAREHALVVDGIERELSSFLASVERGPRQVRSVASVHHLATAISGRLRAPTHVLELVRALHPTPAVAGAPKHLAHAWITENEPEERGYYAGPVGWIGPGGDGAFAVAIRSALVCGQRAWVHAGAGLVPGSNAISERAETEAKMQTLLALLGVP